MSGSSLQIKPSNVVTVALSGADFTLDSSPTPIQDAIDSISNASFTNRFIIRIAPGTYPENVVGKNFVLLFGDTISGVRIAPTSGIAYTAPSIFSTMNNINIEMDVIASGSKCFEANSGGQHFLLHSFLRMTSSTPGVTGMLVDSNSDSFIVSTNNLLYQMTGTGGGQNTHEPFRVTGSGNISVDSVLYNAVLGDSDDDLAMVKDEMTGIFNMEGSEIRGFSTNPSYTGIFKGIHITGVSTEKTFNTSVIHLSGAGGGTGEGIRLETSGAAIANSSFTDYKISGFSSNIYSNVAVNDELISNVDLISSETFSEGEGLVTFQNAQASGKFVKSNPSTFSIFTANEWHAIDTLDSTTVLNDLEFVEGEDGLGLIISDAGGGEVNILGTTSTLVAGDYITIVNSTNYNGIFEVQSVGAGLNNFNIIHSFDGTEVLNYNRSAGFKVLKRGTYEIKWTFEMIPSGNNKEFGFASFKNLDIIDGSEVGNRFGAGGDATTIQLSTVDNFEVNDIIWVGIENRDDTTDISIESGNIYANKIS